MYTKKKIGFCASSNYMICKVNKRSILKEVQIILREK